MRSKLTVELQADRDLRRIWRNIWRYGHGKLPNKDLAEFVAHWKPKRMRMLQRQWAIEDQQMERILKWLEVRMEQRQNPLFPLAEAAKEAKKLAKSVRGTRG